MKIAVNTRLLLKDKLEGIGWFSVEVLKRICQQHPEHEFYFIFDRAYAEEFIFAKNVHPIVAFPPARHPFLYYLFFEFSIPRILKKLKADAFISTDGYSSLSLDIPILNVIHDINFEHRPQDLPWLSLKYYTYFFPKFAKSATRVATVSEFSKKDISETYSIPLSKIDVVYNGCDTRYAPIPTSNIQETRDRVSAGRPYFLYVGALHARKNIQNLLKAFDLFKTKSKSDTKLLIVGRVMWDDKSFKAVYDNLIYKDEVLFLGRISNEALKDILASALALTYVPFYEGFGIPLIEAMNSGIPVITSNVTSLPEVAGGTALLCDPASVEQIMEAMVAVDKDEALRSALIAKGYQRSKEFSWDKTAKLVWESFEKMIVENGKKN